MTSVDRKPVGPAILVVLIGLASLLPGTPAASQICLDHVGNYNYSPSNCEARPEINRVFRLQTITWKDHEYLFVDEGNEIRIFNIDNPFNPVSIAGSVFNIPNVGDSDYDLYNFSVCDNCRYGIASYKAATVLFDLGPGATPSFVDETKNFGANIVPGGFTFSYGGQQYLVASSLGPSPCTNYVSGLYQFNDVEEVGNPLLACLENGGGSPRIVNGISIESVSPPVFYMSERFDQFRIYQLQTTPVFGLDYLGNGGIPKANMFRGYGIDVDEIVGLAAVVDDGELFIYDIGFGGGSPVGPILLSTTILATPALANAVAIDYPIVHVAQQYSPAEPSTWDVSNPANPLPLDQDFWGPTKPWNLLGSCIWNNHAVFSDDGAALYLSRYSSLQVIDRSACTGPIAQLFEDGFESGTTTAWSFVFP